MSDIRRHEESFQGLLGKITAIAELLGVNFSDGIGWDLKQMTHTYKALYSLLPFDEGDRVVLVAQPKLQGTWSSCGHFLKPGEEGVVHSIEMSDGELSVNVIMDNETWIDSKGKKQPVTQKHTWYFPLSMVRKAECGCKSKSGIGTKGSTTKGEV